MATTLPKYSVNPPDIDPYRYGLLSVAAVVDEAGKWQVSGVEFDTDACAQGGYVSGMCAEQPGDHDKGHAEGLHTVEGPTPFAVYVRTECNAVGFHEAEPIARARLEWVTPRLVEEFYSREVLAQLGTSRMERPLGDQAVPLRYAVGVLEQHAGQQYAGRPVLHAPRWVAPFFPLRDTSENDDLLRSAPLGSPVAFGAGYLDDPFTAAARDLTLGQVGGVDGTFWLFATGSVRVRRGELHVYETFDPPTNTRLALAERPHSVETDCFMAAVRVDLSREIGAGVAV
ncbi:hypothetical protein ACFU0X_10195 [Streptomyces cellulosae]|uniref:Uncharacterized protein n=1 Tax=Streptomyces cellulosae TaxID=1968 RepID=A0ABW6JDH2_STRCE